MKKYFYSDGKVKHGPQSLEELKQANISNNTLIWFEGLEHWTPASEIEELKPILELKPPPISTFSMQPGIENDGGSNVIRKQGMFSSPFSFDGRIRRTEYGISFIIYVIVTVFVNPVVASGKAPIIGLAYIPLLWFLWAQGAKRCHDLGNNGWWQIIPFYALWLIFQDGQKTPNQYGSNPKS